MLVKERMSKPVITINPDMTITDALHLMRQENIRRTPVIQDGKLVGIVSEKDLLNASPSSATSLSIWELNYLINRIKVTDIMTKDVLTVDINDTIEKAARTMSDSKIGGLPVTKEGKVVGIITETDLFKIFLEITGAREPGVRLTALVPEKIGKLAELTKAIAMAGGNFIAFGQFSGEDPSNRGIMFKVIGIDEDKIVEIVTPHVAKIIDIRTISV